MRESAAILLTALLFVNLFGYRLIFTIAEQRADVAIEAALDNASYNEEELITITVPLSNPYQLNQPEFERVDGEITIEGKVYRYVKRKIINGELILQCIPHYDKMRLQDKKQDYFAKTNDLSQDIEKNQSSSKSLNVQKCPVVEYDSQFLSDFSFTLIENINAYAHQRAIIFPSVYYNVPGKPPQVV